MQPIFLKKPLEASLNVMQCKLFLLFFFFLAEDNNPGRPYTVLVGHVCTVPHPKNLKQLKKWLIPCYIALGLREMCHFFNLRFDWTAFMDIYLIILLTYQRYIYYLVNNTSSKTPFLPMLSLNQQSYSFHKRWASKKIKKAM